MKNRGFDFGDFEITKREILASISIIAMMLLIGFVISGRISNYILDRNEKYNKAIKIESSELFEYGMITNVGYAFVYGDLKAVDTVSYPEINGEYMYIEKIEEHYNMHTRTVTTTDSKGKTHADTIRQRATPRASTALSTAKQNRIAALSASGYSTSEIAEALGVSSSTVSKYLNGKE